MKLFKSVAAQNKKAYLKYIDEKINLLFHGFIIHITKNLFYMRSSKSFQNVKNYYESQSSRMCINDVVSSKYFLYIHVCVLHIYK